MDKKRCCALLGHSPMRFRFGWDEENIHCVRLKIALLQQIQILRGQGVTQLMTACDPGVELWAAEIVNSLRSSDDALQLYCALPQEGQSTKWAPYLRERCFEMPEKCTYIMAVSTRENPNAQLNSCKYIICHSDMVLAVCDPASARGGDTDQAMVCAAALRKRQSSSTLMPVRFKP